MNQTNCVINKENINSHLRRHGTPKHFEINQSSVGQLCIEMPDFFDPVTNKVFGDSLAGNLFGKKVLWNKKLTNNVIGFIY